MLHAVAKTAPRSAADLDSSCVVIVIVIVGGAERRIRSEDVLNSQGHWPIGVVVLSSLKKLYYLFL